MKNINTKEQVEVMALFGYKMTPCEPLSFKRKGDKEVEVSSLLATRVKFVDGIAYHVFDVRANQKRYTLEFNPSNLHWSLTLA